MEKTFTVATVEYKYVFPDTFEGYLEKGFTSEAVLTMIEADLTRRLQSQVRALLDGEKKPEEIQEVISGYTFAPGTRKAGGSAVTKAANILASLPKEALLELAENPEKAREILAKYIAAAKEPVEAPTEAPTVL